MKGSLIILAIALIFVASEAAKNRDAILLRDVNNLTFRKNEWTSFRRTSAQPQLTCLGGSAGCDKAPNSVFCRNIGHGIRDEVEWKCEADMSESVKFGDMDVVCEGYDHPDDRYVLSGSCGLEFKLELTAKGRQQAKERQERLDREREEEEQRALRERERQRRQRQQRDEDRYRQNEYAPPPPRHSTATEESDDFIFGALFVAFVLFIVFVFVCAKRAPPPPPRAARQPPYNPSYTDHGRVYPDLDVNNNSNNSGPGFWSGAATGAAAGFAAGRYTAPTATTTSSTTRTSSTSNSSYEDVDRTTRQRATAGTKRREESTTSFTSSSRTSTSRADSDSDGDTTRRTTGIAGTKRR